MIMRNWKNRVEETQQSINVAPTVFRLLRGKSTHWHDRCSVCEVHVSYIYEHNMDKV